MLQKFVSQRFNRKKAAGVADNFEHFYSWLTIVSSAKFKYFSKGSKINPG